MGSDETNIAKFEKALDAELRSMGIFAFDAAAIVVDGAGAISMAYSRLTREGGIRGLLADIARGFDVVVQELIGRSGGAEYTPDRLLDDLCFMSHYFILREYLYYTYNQPKSFKWSFRRDSVRVELVDESIPRQFAQYPNSIQLSRIDFYAKHGDTGVRIIELLRGKEETGQVTHIQKALILAEQEANIRISDQFDILGGVSVIQFEGIQLCGLLQGV